MQTGIEPTPLRLGILAVTTSLLEEMFCLPEGYRIVGASYDQYLRILNFTLLSDNLPEVEDTHLLPQLRLLVTQETLPNQPHEYRKITTKVEVL